MSKASRARAVRQRAEDAQARHKIFLLSIAEAMEGREMTPLQRDEAQGQANLAEVAEAKPSARPYLVTVADSDGTIIDSTWVNAVNWKDAVKTAAQLVEVGW